MKTACAVIVFAKAPLPGYAKTRLIPALGGAGAAALATRMLHETLARAAEADIGPVELCCAPDATNPVLMGAAQRYEASLTSQGEGDLGQRMYRALARRLQVASSAIVIGTDCPGLGANDLRDAARHLADHPAVFAPAADGGYVLAGISSALPALFEDIAWSTDQVMAQTRRRLESLGLVAAELPIMHDVDTVEDLVHVPQGWLP
jgi:rSAM/selenodomain-associated transferase 1